MVLTRSQTNKIDDEDRRTFLTDERPDADPPNVAAGARHRNTRDPDVRTGARRKNLQNPDPRATRALLGLPVSHEPEPEPQLGTSDTFTMEQERSASPPINTSPRRKKLESHLNRTQEREQREQALFPRQPVPRDDSANAAGALPYSLAAPSDPAPTARFIPRGEPQPRSVMFDDRTTRNKPPSERSIASNVTESRKREAELRAAEELAALQRKRLQIEEELIQKRLAAEIAKIEKEGSRASGSIADSTRRVSAWLKEVHIADADTLRRHRTPSPRDYERVSMRHRMPTPTRREPDTERTSRRLRSPTPTRRYEHRGATPRRQQERASPDREPPTPRTIGTSRERSSSRGAAIDRLTDHLASMTRRPPPQVYELPSYSGEPGEWLTYFNSYTESTKRYNFSNFENVSRLRNSLKGEARQCVLHMLSSTTNPDLILRVLKKNFGRSDLLIDRAIEELKRLPPVGPSATDLNTFAIKVTNIVATLVGLDKQSYGANPLLIREITERLSPHLRSRWCSFAKDNKERFENELSMIAEFLLSESDNELEYSHARAPAKRATNTPTTTATNSIPRKPTSSGGGAVRRVPSNLTQQRTYVVEQTEAKKSTCLCCGGAHKTPECRRLLNLTVGARWDWVRLNRVCFKCLNSRHRREHCRTKGCGEPGCPHSHHRLLHEQKSPVATNSTPPNMAIATEQPVTYVLPEQTLATSTPIRTVGRDVLLKIIPVIVSGPKGERLTHALLDEGSTISLIDQGLADTIGLVGPESSLSMKGVGAMRNNCMSQTVRTAVRGTKGGNTHTLTLRTVRSLGLRGQRVPQRDIMAFPHMQGLEHACYESATPYILIGADNWHLMVPQEIRVGGQNEPAAVRVDLGWVIYGVTPRIIRTNEEIINHISEPDRELNDLLKHHFSVDALGVSGAVKTRPEVERAQQVFENTVRRIPGPRYEVGQLWRTDDPELPPNYLMALKRLKNLEAKMDRNPEFASSYSQQIDNLVTKGYAEKLRAYEPSKKDFFLPHFAVTNPNKPGKVRLVFDAAAQTQGKSLNDFILEGPDLLQSLPGILFRFREGKYACTSDIQEMFLQVWIREEDRPSQMFLWRGNDRTSEPSIYVMRSMIFGASSSPFLAHSVRNRNAMDNKVEFPLAVKEILYNHYMDDYVTSYSSEQECLRVASEVAASHARGGFTLRGWSSNCSKLLQQIPEEMRAKQPTTFGEKTEKILGMLWNAENDELAFNTQMLRVPADVRSYERGPTKREMLSAVMSVFDPLGLIAQFVISAKIQLQRLWAINIGWDEPLPDNEKIEFQRWLRALKGVAELRIPRQYFRTGGETRYTLHVFVDASAQAYAITGYWRAESPDGVAVSLVAAKAKVAPTKPLSIPRLELQAALIGARLQQTIKKEQRLHAEQTTLWSDSKTVLHWIRDDARRYNAYVAHRLGEIAELTDASQWRWVPTKLNPADDGTRSDPERKVSANDRWYQGPAFLRLPESEWPQETPTNIDPIELKKSECCNAITHQDLPLPDITRFSDYERLLRATARVLQFIERMKGKRPIDLELSHIKKAEQLWSQHSQKKSFPEEFSSLSKNELITKTSKLYKLDPELGEDGLIRMKSRINAAPMSNQSRKPIILDGRDPYVRLLILHTHKRALHSNNERVVNDLRQTYWILHLRPSVRAVAIACRFCAVRRAMPQIPALGDLPAERMTPFTRPFSYAAVDYMGPVTVSIGRRREKRWIALFTCLTTRAIHLEIVASLTTDSAIMALRRMGARRGYPFVMFSDNATCFRGADSELRAAYAEWLPALRNFGLRERMQWRFIPPGAPNQGGAWERLVRSVKAALAATLHTRAPREEVLQTVLAEAENSINARPLTHVSVDPRDPEALTPHHFLLGGSTGLPETGPCDEADRRTWRATQALSDHFWARWVREYLPTLAPRLSTNAGERQLQKGDCVVIADSSLPRNVWPRGIIEATYPGPDGVVRSADVRTKGGVFRRPTRKLAVLPVQP